MSDIKILIVEDELLIAENLAMKLKKFGYTVADIVSSGKAALKYIDSEIPDLILMDISIKGKIDGIETAAKIREIEEVPIVFLTAYADDETLERAAKIGCYGYILKPFKDRELHATIKMALSKHQEQTAIQSSLQAIINESSTDNNDIHIDELTQLPNQLFLRELFEYMLLGYKQSSSSNSEIKFNSSQKDRKLLALIYFNIDRFERINNSLGIESGKLLIKAVAEKLTECRENLNNEIEAAFVRLQNGEFVILLSNFNQKKVVTEFVELILQKLQQVQS